MTPPSAGGVAGALAFFDAVDLIVRDALLGSQSSKIAPDVQRALRRIADMLEAAPQARATVEATVEVLRACRPVLYRAYAARELTGVDAALAALGGAAPAGDGRPDPSMCIHRFMGDRQCYLCGWDFRNGEPPATPAGDGVTIGEFMGPLAAKFGESAAPAGDGEMQYVGIVVEAPNGGLAISTPAAPAGGGGEEPAEPWRPINELPNSDDLFWFRRGAAIDGPRVSQPSGLDADEWDYFAPCEAPSIRRLASGGGGELLAVRTMDDLRNAAAGADYYFRPVQMRPQDAREILARLASTRPAGGGASGADEGDIEAIAAEVELLFANPGNDGGDARRLADRIRRLASAGSARGIPWWELAREAADVLEAVGTSGVPLPDNWRWPLADELSGAAALASRTGSAPAPSGWRPDYHTLRCWLFGIGVVGQIDGHEVIRRDSVVSLLERWLAAPTQEPSHAD